MTYRRKKNLPELGTLGTSRKLINISGFRLFFPNITLKFEGDFQPAFSIRGASQGWKAWF